MRDDCSTHKLVHTKLFREDEPAKGSLVLLRIRGSDLPFALPLCKRGKKKRKSIRTKNGPTVRVFQFGSTECFLLQCGGSVRIGRRNETNESCRRYPAKVAA